MQIFLGRERELKLLTDVLSNVLNGESRVVHIKGAKGLGKTSLIKEFLKRVPDNVIRIHSAHVRPGYGVIREFVKKFGDRRRLLGRVLPMEAVYIYPDLSSYFVFPEHDGRPVDEYFILYEFLDRLSDISPVVLVLDNMELYTDEDLDLVRKLILSLEGKPIMFILVSTPDISFYKTLAVDLEPLSLEDLLELHIPVEMAERLYRVTGGIPTLMNQLLFSMRHLNLDPQMAFSPEVLDEIYGKILDLLSEEEKEFLRKVALTDYVDVQSPIFRHLKNLGLVDEEGIRLHGLKEYILGLISEEERRSFYRKEALALLDEFRKDEAFDVEKLHRLVRYMELSGLDEKYPEEFSRYALMLGDHYKYLNKFSLAMEFYSRVRMDPYRKQAALSRLFIAIRTGGHGDVDKLFQQVKDDPQAVEQYAKYLLFMRRFDEYRDLVRGKETPILRLYYLYYKQDYAT
ncbi:MAG: ATP-binding protein, partial [Thermotogae bacterium]|nr:ATP-binding protein [Thermotogota bacterium]